MDQNQLTPTPASTTVPTNAATAVPAQDITAAPAPTSTPIVSAPSTSPSDLPAPDTMPTDAPVAHTAIKKPRSNIMLIVGIVLLIVLALTGVAYKAMSKPAVKESKATTPATSQTTVKDPASTSSSIDASISKLNETKDYSTADLSDATLGL